MGFVSVTIVAVNRASRLLGAVCGSAMPYVGIEYDDSARWRFKYDFVGMGEEWVIHCFFRHFAAEVGSGNETRGSIGNRKIV